MNENIKKIKLIIFDVDGVLTDGHIFFGLNGDGNKFFDVQDGLGILLAKHVHMKIAIISGRNSKAVIKRAEELGINEVYQGVDDKREILEKLKEKFKLNADQIAYVGDDLGDIKIMKEVGYSLAPNNAVDEVKKIADYITKSKGGCGAVRESIEVILKAQDKWKEAINKFIE